MQGDKPVVVAAVRTPIGKKKGGLSTVHPADLLAATQRAVIERSGVDPAKVGQVVGGTVAQVGEQSFDVARTAWLVAGLPMEVAATTVDAQCGSSQQAATLAAGLVAGGLVNSALACGVESMSRIPIGSSVRGTNLGRPINRNYRKNYEYYSQFQGAEMVAAKWGVTRQDTDEFALMSQQRAAAADAADRFVDQIVPITAAVRGEDGEPTDETATIARDECMRPTTLEALAQLKPVEDDGIHTAGSSSQIADGASAVLMVAESELDRLGVKGRAVVEDSILVGVDPETMLTGPIPATEQLLARNGLKLSDIDVVEINEAFASVVLAWAREFNADFDRVNPNGGAIAMGHPLGASGTILLTKALNELERVDGEWALVTMCCGGGLGTGTLLRRR